MKKIICYSVCNAPYDQSDTNFNYKFFDAQEAEKLKDYFDEKSMQNIDNRNKLENRLRPSAYTLYEKLSFDEEKEYKRLDDIIANTPRCIIKQEKIVIFDDVEEYFLLNSLE